MDLTIDLDNLLDDLRSRSKETLETVPPVELVGDDFDAVDIPSAAAEKWVKIRDIVVVVFDLKGSTQLGTGGKHDTSTARIYKSAVDGAVKVMHDFEADYIDIQGDGGFGVFWGEGRYERAICAGITIRKFSESWIELLKAKQPTVPDTGFKVGVASSRILVKQLGTRNDLDEQEAVWAGRAVNYAAKCAQAANVDQLVATNRVWERLENNDYVAFSCTCKSSPTPLWIDFEVETLPEGDREAVLLVASWCDTCGPEFCTAILDGKRNRDELNDTRREEQKAQVRLALEAKVRREATHRYPK